MNRLLVVVVLVGSVVGVGCNVETTYVFPDAGLAQDAALQSDAPACGPDTYPCPPYGTAIENTIEDLTFTGWVDDTADHTPLNNPYRTWGFDYFFQQALTSGAKYLYLNVSAGWCSVCKVENGVLPGIANDYRDQGILFAEVLFEDAQSNPASADFVKAWATKYHLNFTVGVDPTFKTGRFFSQAATPANFAISLKDQTLAGSPVRAMEIIFIDTGFVDEATTRSSLDTLLTP
ncbi:MAG TPA: TlpA disulfide reductase family protein [Polyangia bacterium]|jgi:thiol-disulfide isomerase/thioredoxin